MRLRRETGDFQIKVTDNDGTLTVNTIRTGLGAEDLIGEVVDADGVLSVIVSAIDGTDEVIARTVYHTLTYVPSTGAITAAGNTVEG